MKSNENIDKQMSSLFGAIDRNTAPPDKELLKKLHDKSTKQFQTSSKTTQSKIKSIWIIIMKTKIRKLTSAAAAVLIIALGIFILDKSATPD